jgi:hypothetical protein
LRRRPFHGALAALARRAEAAGALRAEAARAARSRPL